MRTYLAIATAALIALTATPIVAAQLVTDLSEHQVRIRSNFTGTQILLFGAIEVNTANERSLDRDVVVVVTGPSRAVTVRRKDRVAGIWINTESITFPNVPGYYAVASSRPLEVTAEGPVLQREQIGIDNVNFGAPLAQGIDGSRQILSVDDEKSFIKALVRNKRREKLYSSDPGGIIFLGQTLFRATVEIPANVPVGLYTATVYLIADGEVVDAISSPLYIDKSGLERFLYRFAHNDALLYGLIAVFGAALAGWLGSAVLRQR
ncbi:MAG: TIGR02186 family protein [Parvibaculum sp.]|nr:TIGR02186 family protein [Parvibaculum sp.]|tara:strand:- start:34110 stop:34901 length:792 start_codon:yes stop_codon:yes gene_type:complete